MYRNLNMIKVAMQKREDDRPSALGTYAPIAAGVGLAAASRRAPEFMKSRYAGELEDLDEFAKELDAEKLEKVEELKQKIRSQPFDSRRSTALMDAPIRELGKKYDAQIEAVMKRRGDVEQALADPNIGRNLKRLGIAAGVLGTGITAKRAYDRYKKRNQARR